MNIVYPVWQFRKTEVHIGWAGLRVDNVMDCWICTGIET